MDPFINLKLNMSWLRDNTHPIHSRAAPRRPYSTIYLNSAPLYGFPEEKEESPPCIRVTVTRDLITVSRSTSETIFHGRFKVETVGSQYVIQRVDPPLHIGVATCAICFEKKQDDQFCSFCCRHYSCLECFGQMISKSKDQLKCPMCRASVNRIFVRSSSNGLIVCPK
jgi:hypothetical protein